MAKLERSEAELKARVEELTREVGEREEMLGEDNMSPIKFPPIFPIYFSHYFLRKMVGKNIMIFSLIFFFIFFFHYIFHVIQTKENNFSHNFFSFP